MSQRVKDGVCQDRLSGRTCRQRWRASFEFWCDDCIHRYDHEHGRHPEPEERCPLCSEEHPHA